MALTLESVNPDSISMCISTAIRSEVDRIHAKLNGDSEISDYVESELEQAEYPGSTVTMLAMERRENSKLRVQLKESVKEIEDLRVWCYDITKTYSKLAENHKECINQRLELYLKLEKEREAHLASKTKIRELKAIVTGLEKVAVAQTKLKKSEIDANTEYK